MGDMDGFQCTYSIIEACNAKNVPIPYIVALSAYDNDEEIKEKCKVVGMEEYVQKPISSKELQYLMQKTEIIWTQNEV